MDIAALERKAKLTTAEAEALFDHHDGARLTAAGEAGDPRRRIKLAKAAADAARRAFQAGSRAPERLARYLAALEAGRAVHAFPAEMARALTQVQAALRAATGGTEPRTLAEARARLALDAAQFAVVDPVTWTEVVDEDPQAAHTAGRAVYVETAADGQVAVTLRVVDGGAALLLEAEGARSAGATAAAVLEVRGDRLGVAADDDVAAVVAISPGRYEVRCFTLGKGYLVVAACIDATAAAPANGTIERLEL